MKFIIHHPVISENTIRVYAELESNPEINFEIIEKNVIGNIESALIRNMEVLSKKITRYYLGQI